MLLRSHVHFFARATGVFALASGALSSGCASLAPTGRPATGEPLSVYSATVTGHDTVQERVGAIERRSADGTTVATSEVFTERDATVGDGGWYPMQGSERVDDQDFFSIAGDQDAAAEVKSYREAGVIMNRIGILGVVLGAAAMAGGYYLGSQSAEVGPNGVATPNPTAKVGLPLLIGGGVVVTTGGTLTVLGMRRTSPDAHAVEDVTRARRAADRYNRRRGTSPVEAGPGSEGAAAAGFAGSEAAAAGSPGSEAAAAATPGADPLGASTR